MAHGISNIEGRDTFAHVGDAAWHGLGTKLEQGASIEQWAEAAGLDYKIERAFVRYATSRQEAETGRLTGKSDDHVVLFHSGTKQPLGVVSPSFKIVQPIESLQFFEEWVSLAGVHLDTAALLFGGKKFFATAKISEGVDLGGGDILVPHALFTSGADGGTPTTCKWVWERVVCANTLAVALGERQAAYKLSPLEVQRRRRARLPGGRECSVRRLHRGGPRAAAGAGGREARRGSNRSPRLGSAAQGHDARRGA